MARPEESFTRRTSVSIVFTTKSKWTSLNPDPLICFDKADSTVERRTFSPLLSLEAA